MNRIHEIRMQSHLSAGHRPERTATLERRHPRPANIIVFHARETPTAIRVGRAPSRRTEAFFGIVVPLLIAAAIFAWKLFLGGN